MSKTSTKSVAQTESNEVTDTETTEADYVFDVTTLVEDYKAGRVSKRAAKTWLETNMLEAVVKGDMSGAQEYGSVIPKLDDASRTSGRKASEGLSSDDYAAAIVARANAFGEACANLLKGSIVPSDVPKAQREEVASLIKAHLDAKSDFTLTVGESLAEATGKPVTGLAESRIIGNNQLLSHLQLIVDGKATTTDGFPFTLVKGQTYRVSEIANLRTQVYPEGVSSGHVASRFTHKQPERFPAGWVYAQVKGAQGSDKLVHGVRFVGVEATA